MARLAGKAPEASLGEEVVLAQAGKRAAFGAAEVRFQLGALCGLFPLLFCGCGVAVLVFVEVGAAALAGEPALFVVEDGLLFVPLLVARRAPVHVGWQ